MNATLAILESALRIYQSDCSHTDEDGSTYAVWYDDQNGRWMESCVLCNHTRPQNCEHHRTVIDVVSTGGMSVEDPPSYREDEICIDCGEIIKRPYVYEIDDELPY